MAIFIAKKYKTLLPKDTKYFALVFKELNERLAI